VSAAFRFLLHNGKSTLTVRSGIPEMVTSTKKGLIPYNIVVGDLHFLLGISVLRVTYHYPGTPPRFQRESLVAKEKP
jgi:hypothetical protein